MSLSSFCVVTNARALNLFDLHDARRDHKRASHLKEVPEIKEETAMKKTISIEGMMCAHCEATVKKALEALPEVTEAVVSHTAGTARRDAQRPGGRRRAQGRGRGQGLHCHRHRVSASKHGKGVPVRGRLCCLSLAAHGRRPPPMHAAALRSARAGSVGRGVSAAPAARRRCG